MRVKFSCRTRMRICPVRWLTTGRTNILAVIFRVQDTRTIRDLWSYGLYYCVLSVTGLNTSVKTKVFFLIEGHMKLSGPYSSVGIATELRARRSGIESRWGRDFPPVQTGPGAHTASCKMGTGSFSGVKCGRGVLLTTHHLLVPRSWKSRAIPLPTLWATTGL